MAGRMTGAFGFGGEIGHMPLNPKGGECGCGSIGCWETEVGETALLARAGLPIDGGRDAVDELLRRARAGDSQASLRSNMSAHGSAAALPASSTCSIPAWSSSVGSSPASIRTSSSRLTREAARLALRPSSAVVSIVPSALGVEAPLLGAAELAFEQLLDDPTSVAE